MSKKEEPSFHCVQEFSAVTNAEEYILSRMERYFLSKEKVTEWLHTHHRMLGGTPRELLDTGREEEILELIFNTIGE